MVVLLFFFFKQMTAYEMRISDWSSDVCSSDLPVRHLRQRVEAAGVHRLEQQVEQFGLGDARLGQAARRLGHLLENRFEPRGGDQAERHEIVAQQPARRPLPAQRLLHVLRGPRSEEHTSELQSLMRISYAV